MLSLQQFINIFEGGAGGHMAHPYDYADFTAADLIDLVDSLFKGKIEDLKEKLDGFNIEATMNWYKSIAVEKEEFCYMDYGIKDRESFNKFYLM